MSIVKFLFYRITDDEEFQNPADCDCLIEGLPPRHGVGCPVKVLAECNAKMRMVASLRAVVRASELWKTSTSKALSQQAEETLRLLALPYSWHPDYDEEWRL